MRWLLDASENHEALQVIEQAAYRRPAVLPACPRYTFVADFAALIGVDSMSFRRDRIISTDGHDPKLIGQLFDRGAMLEPLAD